MFAFRYLKTMTQILLQAKYDFYLKLNETTLDRINPALRVTGGKKVF